jgi:hypothetical protein
MGHSVHVKGQGSSITVSRDTTPFTTQHDHVMLSSEHQICRAGDVPLTHTKLHEVKLSSKDNCMLQKQTLSRTVLLIERRRSQQVTTAHQLAHNLCT